MNLLNTNSVDGPRLVKVFICDKCKYLSNTNSALSHFPYKCIHPDILKDAKGINFFTGDIGNNKLTPDTCPLLFKKMIKEKLEEINNNLNDK